MLTIKSKIKADITPKKANSPGCLIFNLLPNTPNNIIIIHAIILNGNIIPEKPKIILATISQVNVIIIVPYIAILIGKRNPNKNAVKEMVSKLGTNISTKLLATAVAEN
jgi:hypothetical protein